MNFFSYPEYFKAFIQTFSGDFNWWNMINKSSKRYARGKEEIKLFLSFMDNKSEDKNDEYKKKEKATTTIKYI